MVNTTKSLQIESDTSEYVTGVVLSMLQDDGKWHSCAYLSKVFNNMKQNYNVHDKEMMGIMHALKAWCHYLEGCKHKIEIWMDHQNLEYFISAKKLNRRQAWWALYLSHFHFHLEHKAGSLMAKANALLRCVDLKKGIESNNKNVTLLKPEFFHVHALCQGHLLIEGQEVKLLSKIRSSKDHEDAVIKAVEELKQSGTKTIRSDEWTLEQGLVLYRRKVYVPKDTKL